MTGRFARNRKEGKLLGVAAGLGDSLRIDPLPIRLAFILALLTTGPVALILYVAAALLSDG